MINYLKLRRGKKGMVISVMEEDEGNSEGLHIKPEISK